MTSTPSKPPLTRSSDEASAARQAVIDTLATLEPNLLAHLAYKAIGIRRTARRLREF